MANRSALFCFLSIGQDDMNKVAASERFFFNGGFLEVYIVLPETKAYRTCQLYFKAVKLAVFFSIKLFRFETSIRL